MSEPETPTPTRNRLTRSLVARLAAVGLFLCIGTVAVVHTIQSRKANKEPPAFDGATGAANKTKSPDGADPSVKEQDQVASTQTTGDSKPTSPGFSLNAGNSTSTSSQQSPKTSATVVAYSGKSDGAMPLQQSPRLKPSTADDDASHNPSRDSALPPIVKSTRQSSGNDFPGTGHLSDADDENGMGNDYPSNHAPGAPSNDLRGSHPGDSAFPIVAGSIGVEADNDSKTTNGNSMSLSDTSKRKLDPQGPPDAPALMNRSNGMPRPTQSTPLPPPSLSFKSGSASGTNGGSTNFNFGENTTQTSSPGTTQNDRGDSVARPSTSAFNPDATPKATLTPYDPTNSLGADKSPGGASNNGFNTTGGDNQQSGRAAPSIPNALLPKSDSPLSNSDANGLGQNQYAPQRMTSNTRNPYDLSSDKSSGSSFGNSSGNSSDHSSGNLNPSRTYPATETNPLMTQSARATPVSTSRSAVGPGGTDSAADLTHSTPGSDRLEGPQVPSLKIQKISPDEVQLGQVADFKLIVQNVSQTPATGVVVYDQVPDGRNSSAPSPKPNSAPAGSLSWNLGDVPPNQTTTIALKLRPVRPGEFGSVAQVTFSAQASARTKCTQPKLAVTMTTKPKVQIHDEVILDISVENQGDGPANHVFLQESLPDQLDFPGGLRDLEYDIGNLTPGQKRNVQLKLTAARVGKLRNEIVAQGDGNLQASDSVELEIVSPKLQVSGDGPTRKYLNREATHQFAVSNVGTAPATNIELVATLPRGLKFVSANNYGFYNAATQTVKWSMPELDIGLVGKVELVTMPVEPGEQKIDFTATANLDQKAVVSKSLTVDYIVEVFCEIDDLIDPIEIGGETAYRIRVVNQGSQPAANVRLTLDFPAGIQPLSVEGDVQSQIQGQRIVFAPITRLDSKQEMTITVKARGTQEGDHRVMLSMSSDDRETPVSKEETTRVYSDRD